MLLQKSTPLKIKLDSAIDRLDRLRLQDHGDDDDIDDGLLDGNWHEQRAEIFEWVFWINQNLQSRSFSTSTLRLVRDAGNVLYNQMNTEGHKESQDDVQAASWTTEDISDVLLDYQVCSSRPYAAGVQLKL